jgi:hypothetical protein
MINYSGAKRSLSANYGWRGQEEMVAKKDLAEQHERLDQLLHTD